MKQKITIRDIASHADVSTATVSHVLNNTRYVSEEVRARVLQACQALGNTPNSLARSLRSGKTRTIGLVLPDSSNPFFAEIGRKIEELAFQQGYSVIICNTEGNLKKELFYVETLGQKQVDGVIFVSAGGYPESLEALQALNVPVVIADRETLDKTGANGLTVVLTDNYTGGQLAAQHAIELGHRRVAIISGPSNLTPSALRETGYRDAMQRAGLDIDPQWVVRGDFTCDAGYAAAKLLYGQNPRPTAIFCCNDMMAIGAIRAAFDQGLNVPADVSIIGFDDIALASYISPTLSTVHQPIEEISREITQSLFKAFEEEAAPVYKRIVIKPGFVARQSSGKVKAE
jgi:LacI family transcriptional regulator